MKFKNSILAIIVLVCLSCKTEAPKIEYLIEFDHFQAMTNQPNTKIIDFRKPERYTDGHVDGAINIWRSDIEDHTYPYKGMIAKKKALEDMLSLKGIDNNDLLLVYDDNGLCDAARFWWVLQQYGYTNIRLVNGSFSSWKARIKPITTAVSKYPRTSFSFRHSPSFRSMIQKDALLASLDNLIILDTRTADEFSGKRQKKGASKGGRIPGSISIDWKKAIYFDSDKRIKSIKELEKLYREYLPSKKDEIIVYCHTGVRSAHTIFVLTQLLDFENVRNYDGSWSEWSYFNDLPFEQDSITTILK